jgi:hypothetical protein
MSGQRINLHLSKQSLALGRRLAQKKKTNISFSERWAGKVALRMPDKPDRRGTQLAKKHS